MGKHSTGFSDIFFWIIAFVLIFWSLGYISLWGSEDRWAEVTREMFLTGRFFHPTINGEPYFDKPLLSYWLIALVKVVTGRLDEWAVRLPSAISAVLSLWATIYLGRKLWSEQVGRLAGWILLTSYGFLFWARTGQANMQNIAAVVLALAWYWSRRDRPVFLTYLVFYIILSIGAQMKGLTAIAVPLVAVIPDVLRQQRWRYLLRPAHFLALGIGIGLYFSPFIYSALTSEGYQSSGLYMVFRENIQRYFQPFDHVEPVYAYFIHLPTLLLPWSPLFFVAVASTIFTVRWRDMGPHSQWLATAAILVFLLFTASGSRRIYYILPMLPFCALFMGLFLTADGREGWKRLGLLLQGVLFITLAAMELITAVVWPLIRSHVGIDLPTALIVSTTVLGLLALAPWLLRRRLSHPLEMLTGTRGRMAPLMATVVILIGGFFCWQKVILEDLATTPDFARRLASTGRTAHEIAFYEKSRTDVIFYMNSQQPHPVLSMPDEILRFLNSGTGNTVLVLPFEDLDRLMASLPEGVQGEPVVVERSPPWQNDTSEALLAWRLKTEGIRVPQKPEPESEDGEPG